MQTADYIVVALFFAGLVGVGFFLASRVKSASDMFSAGGRSPWWVSGLSSFMTMFSAGTFVVWGGVAYRFGMVAVSISICYGVAALLAGWLVAGKWHKLGVTSAAEYLEVRFGRSIVQFYTWIQAIYYMAMGGGMTYGLAKLTCRLIAIDPGVEETFWAFLRDDVSGQLSIPWLSAALLSVVVVICFAGGLLAVLITDVLQFIVLSVSVVTVVPLLLIEVGGVGEFLRLAPEGFMAPTHTSGEDFGWWFLAGWVAIHFFKIGAEWAFVQRFTCVPTARDAKLSAGIFGVMYLISPLFWMLPPMIYRVLPASTGKTAEEIRATAEVAYVDACHLVLPAGMIGLMIAAMMSATASAVTTQLNVYAGAFTQEIYARVIRKDASDAERVAVGRVMTLLLGAFVLLVAVLMHTNGDNAYTRFVLSTTALLIPPLLLPTLWSLFSRHVGLGSAWVIALSGVALTIIAKTGLGIGETLDSAGEIVREPRWLANAIGLEALSHGYEAHNRVGDILVGNVPPLVLLAATEIVACVRRAPPQPGVARIEALAADRAGAQDEPATPSKLPLIISGWTIAGLAAVMGVLTVTTLTAVTPSRHDDPTRDAIVLGGFAAVLAMIALGTLFIGRRKPKTADPFTD
ncbi:MAG: Na+:solute symporter [Phycisphaerae bacterium]|nr:Na+:solute symporter [Phycisphaerae bacterium]